MHYRLLVTTGPAASSLAARRQVSDGLYKQGFIENPAVRWSGGIADWFVIGGRFSGCLARFGTADDAMLLTSALYDRFLAQYEGFTVDGEYVDLEGEQLSREFIGRKWLVVVDYHH